MKNLFKSFTVLSFIFSWGVWAHEGHHELKASPALSGSSVLQLDSSWKTQNGDTIKLSALAGTPRLVVMLYTSCETACPLIVEDLKGITEALTPAQRKKVAVTLFSIDPARDTPAALAAFAKKRHLPKDWELLTSDAHTVSELAAALGFRYKRLADGEYIHSNVIFLLNQQGVAIARKEGLKTPAKDFIKQIQKAL
jgi:protein SCO1/2